MHHKKRYLLLALVLAGLLGASVQAFGWAKAFYTARAQETARATLVLVVEALDQAVGRFSPIPGLIAGDPDLRRLLNESTAQGYAPFMNEKLRQVAISVGASEIYVMDLSGRTVAASNYRDADSFLGRSFAFRPYFTQAASGKAAVFHALGTTSGERGFFFSAPILDGIEVIGVLAIKITVGALERDWDGIGHDILIADANGIVFLASREEFLFRALAPLSDAALERIAGTQQFPLARVTPMGLSADVIGPQTVQVTIRETAQEARYLASSTPLTLAGWHAISFTSVQTVQSQVARAMAVAGLALTAALLAGLVIVQRRANILQRIRFEQDQRVYLEQEVRARTADLNRANATLRDEVAERRRTEERLRKSQKELVQAGKLAALGQMSAAISHEINQPLAAIKSYAENASEFLVRSRVADATGNLKSISQMTDRIAEISRHLRTFARQPGEALSPIHVPEVIQETIGLVGPQLRASNATIRYTPPQPPETGVATGLEAGPAIWALGGRLRLQQVLVNIINNALEAMKPQAALLPRGQGPDQELGHAPVIDITLAATEDAVSITLRDHGPGLPPDTMEQVFDAFYTTKEAGSGMGLGMSISHNIISDFGGALTAGNHPEGGAVFTVTLQPHPGPHPAPGPQGGAS